jgi:hypothetical protein
MIGRIRIFFPYNQDEAKSCVANETKTTREGQIDLNVEKEELEQTLEDA